MSCVVNESFPKSIRLRKRAEFLSVQETGVKVSSGSFFGLYLIRSGQKLTRLGITTSKKMGNAVERNHVRRLVREAFRRNSMDVPRGIDLVIIAKKRAAGLYSREIYDDLSKLGRRIRQSLEERR